MIPLLVIARQELRAGVRNRWIVAMTLLLAALALSLVLVGSAPTGSVGVSPLAVVIVSLASLTIFLVPLVALMLSFDAIVGEQERGTLLLLLAYPVARWQVVLGKFAGHVVILAIATVFGYGAAGVMLHLGEGAAAGAWPAFIELIASSILLGVVFAALGGLLSIVVRERATAAGLAVGLWLVLILLYDAALLGVLVADQGATVTAEVLNVLLLLNPADVYRLINLAGHEAVAELAGMGVTSGAGLAPAALYAALFAWIVVPLVAAVVLFARRQP